MDSRPSPEVARFAQLSSENEWVIINPSRAGVAPVRDQGPPESRPTESTVPSCPFCPPSHLAAEPYDVLIFANENPILVPNPAPGPDGTTAAHGVNDVVVPSPRHDEPFDACDAPRIGRFLRALRNRHERHFADDAIRSIYTFVASGERFGPSQLHPHGQLLGLPFVPQRMANLLRGDAGECLVCAESDHSPGRNTVLLDSDNFRAYLPSAPKVAHEIWISHRAHGTSLPDLTDRETDEVAELIRDCLRATQSDRFNPYFVNVQDLSPRLDNRHLRFEIVAYGRPDGGEKYLSAVELGLGVFVNPFDPVSVAARLRTIIAEDR